MRRLAYLFLLLCLPLYGFAMQGGMTPVIGAALHEIGHNSGFHHHHEDDGSVHYDESDASLDHAEDHSSPSQPAAFLLVRLAVPPEQLVFIRGHYVTRATAAPFLEGPQRPPAFSLGQTAGGMLHS